ncbi:MAG: fused MFS/spermidine synthase [Bacteroidota bacterium]
MQKIPFHKRLISYIYPVKIRESSSSVNPVLELFFYRNRYQLATLDALYSDGDKYRPLTIAFKAIKEQLPKVRNVLVLGTGLGSAVHILDGMGCQPNYTLVEIDKQVLQWALEFLPTNVRHVLPVHEDAVHFVQENEKKYDLLIVDVFVGREVPDFVISNSFIEKCHQSVIPGGHFIVNYIVNDNRQWEKVQQKITNIFPKNKIISLDMNRIIIATV